MSRLPSPSVPTPAAADTGDPATPISSGASMRRLWVLMATVFIDMIGAMIVLPLLPFYVLRMGAKPSIVGPLISTFFIAQIVFSPLWGRLSDRYGRRPMILAGLLLSAAAYTLFGLAHTLLLLFLSRLVQGAGSGTVGVVQAYVGDSVAPEERAKALGWVTAATSFGVVIGPTIGSLASYFGRSGPGYFAAGLCLLNVAFAGRWLPESRRHDAGHAAAARPLRSLWHRLWEVVRQPLSPIGSLIWVYAIGMMAFMAMNAVLSLYLGHVYGVTEKTIGWFYTYVGVISVVMRAVLLGPAVRRLGEVGAMRAGALSLALGMAAIPLPAWLQTSQPLRIACLAVIVTLVPVGTALLFPSTTALVSRRSPRGEMGQIMGVQQLFGGITRFLGPIWSTWLFGASVALPFWAASAFMLSGGFLTWRIQREPRARPGAAAPAPVELAQVTAAADLPDARAAAELSGPPAEASPAPAPLRG
ncbi:MAG TPA: MFS transporter [Thermoanaerobaculia bacterium]|jgi:MFS family permease|nr:MFS transporter [Thermoanaerobaculia bacterium]